MKDKLVRGLNNTCGNCKFTHGCNGPHRPKRCPAKAREHYPPDKDKHKYRKVDDYKMY